jgi:protein MpaA
VSKTYFGGERPATEPETRAIMRAVETLRPARIVSIHNMPDGRECNNYDGPAEPLARRMHDLNHYAVRANIGYPTPGSLGGWAGVDAGMAVITLELPRSASNDQVWAGNREALLALIRASN